MKLSMSLLLSVVISLASQLSLPSTAQDISGFKMPPADSLPVARNAKWDLPIEEALDTTGGGKGKRRFDVSIDLSDTDNCLGAQVERLTDRAWARDEEAQALDKAVAHFRTRTQRVVAQSKDTADYIIPFRGFGPSSEAGDVILGEKLKLKSRGAAEYARQKHADELNLAVVSHVLQIAMGIGISDPAKRSAVVESGRWGLEQLVGAAEAAATYDTIKGWAREVDVPAAVFQQPAWDVTEKQKKLQTILEASLSTDPVLQQITQGLHKYNQHSRLARASAHVVQMTLGAAALTPNFIGPAAKAALVAYVTATGGPEQSKLLKELYLDKRFESRWRVLNEQAHLALENYQVGVLTHNAPLVAASQAVVEQMSGRAVIKQVFGTNFSREPIAATSQSL
jgi:hypothetical protein